MEEITDKNNEIVIKSYIIKVLWLMGVYVRWASSS